MVLYKAINPPLTSHLVDLNQVFWFSNSKVKTSLRCKWDGSDVCLAPVGAIRGKCWCGSPQKGATNTKGWSQFWDAFFGAQILEQPFTTCAILGFAYVWDLVLLNKKAVRYQVCFQMHGFQFITKDIKNAHRFVYINSLIEHIHKYAIYLYRGDYQMNISPLCLSALKVLCRWGIFYALGASPTVEGED